MARHDWEWAIGIRMQADIPCRRAPLPLSGSIFLVRWKRRRATNRGSDRRALPRDQFLLRPTELQRILGDAAHQDVEELWVDSAFEGSGGESVRLVR